MNPVTTSRDFKKSHNYKTTQSDETIPPCAAVVVTGASAWTMEAMETEGDEDDENSECAPSLAKPEDDDILTLSRASSESGLLIQ